jgi:hypothetical protein
MNRKDMVHELHFSKKEVKMSNQDIIEFAYAIKELISPLWGVKLSHDKANCYYDCFYKVQELLKLVDSEYLEAHKKVVAFYREGRVQDKDMEILYWVDKDNSIMK